MAFPPLTPVAMPTFQYVEDQDEHLPVIPVNVSKLHAQDPVDFSNEDEVKKYVRPSRWFAMDLGPLRVLRGNWVVFLFASIFLWLFVILVLAMDKEDSNPALAEFGNWMQWIAQNFTWLYIATQVRAHTGDITATDVSTAICARNTHILVPFCPKLYRVLMRNRILRLSRMRGLSS
jgi:hypothetical protein